MYEIYGLRVGSCLECREMTPASGSSEVTIRYGSVPDSLEEPRVKSVWYEIAPGSVLFSVEHVAKYWISNGDEIVIERFPAAEDTLVKLYLFGTAFGALLHQRGFVPLHGSAIAVDGGCVAFLGPSGIGKSTLAAAFLERGYQVLADDVCTVSFRPDGSPVAVPGYPYLKLPVDSAGKLSLDPVTLSREREESAKPRYVPEGKFCRQSLPLTRLYILDAANMPEFHLTPLRGVEKLTAILLNTYRREALEGLGIEPVNIRQCAELGRHTNVTRVTRPENGFFLHELVDRIEEDFSL